MIELLNLDTLNVSLLVPGSEYFLFRRVAFFNTVLIFLFCATLFAICNRGKDALIVSTILLYVLALIEHFVSLLRGTPFSLDEIFSAGTAADVVTPAMFTIDVNIAISTFMCILLVMLATRMDLKIKHIKGNIGFKVLLVAALCATPFLVTDEDMTAHFGTDRKFWNPSQDAQLNGYFYYTLYDTFNSKDQAPIDYSAQAMESILDSASSENAEGNEQAASSTQPNIVMIMSESLTDYTTAPGWNQEDYLDYIHSLDDTGNAYVGYLAVSTFGGGTVRTEWESLTGNTTAFIDETLPYQSVTTDGAESIVSTLSSQGYTCLASHPANAENYKRNTIYGYLGFDDFITTAGYGENDYYNTHISDEAFYNSLINLYEKHEAESGTPLFLFGVSMQNHEPFGNAVENTETVSYQDGTNAQFDDYLSGAATTDDQTKILIDYFSHIDEPTLVIIYGDHHPKIADLPKTQLYGQTEPEGLESIARNYETPIVIWANYDIDLSELDTMSANYLASTVLDVAGLETTSYDDFLLALKEVFPIITSEGVVDTSGNYYTLEYAEDNFKKIAHYHMVEYNNLFDKENRLTPFFYLTE